MSTGKRCSLTIQQRLDVLQDLKTSSIVTVAAKYKVHPTTIRRIKINEGSINHLPENGKEYKYWKRLRIPKYGQVEEELLKWFKQRKAAGDPLSDALLLKKANEIKNTMESCSHFKVSTGWLTNFKNRYHIRLVCTSNNINKVSVDVDATIEFVDKFKRLIEEEGINLQNVYNMDENGLLWKSMPTKTLITKDERYVNGSKKDRITIALCTNATGTHKLDPLIIHKYKKPRALKNCIDKLLIVLKSQPIAAMTQNIFIDWYDNHFKPSVRKYQLENGLCGKTILLLDDRTGHRIPNYEDEHFKIVYLPANTTALIQPIDQGIIKKVKKSFRHQLMKKAVNHEKGIQGFYEHYNIKDCVDMLCESWADITNSDIKNAWSKIILEYADEPCEEKENVLLDDLQVAMSTIPEQNVSREYVSQVLEERLEDERNFTEEVKQGQEGEDASDDNDNNNDGEEEDDEKEDIEEEEEEEEGGEEEEDEVTDENMDIEIGNEIKTEMFDNPKDRGIALNSEERKELEDIFRRLEHFNSQVSHSTQLQLESVKLLYLGEP